MTCKRPFKSQFSPLSRWSESFSKAHGRIEQRTIHVLPATALGDHREWPSLKQIAKIVRTRQIKKKGQWVDQSETAWLITSLSADEASPRRLLGYNRKHWRIENNLHRSKDVFLGEDAYTNRKDHAPRNIFSLNNLVLFLFKAAGLTPKKAIEHFQDDKNLAIHMLYRLL